MSEAAPEKSPTTPATPAVPAAPATTAAPAANGDPVQLPEDHPLVKAYNAQKDTIKSLKSAQVDPDELKRLRELEEATKTEAQKQADALAAAQAKVKDYEAKEQVAGWKAEVSKDTGVPATALAGSTKEEIEAHAAVLKELITPADPAATLPNGPTVPGQMPGSPATPALITQADLDALSAAGKHKEINELRRAGRLSHLGVAPPKQR